MYQMQTQKFILERVETHFKTATEHKETENGCKEFWSPSFKNVWFAQVVLNTRIDTQWKLALTLTMAKKRLVEESLSLWQKKRLPISH